MAKDKKDIPHLAEHQFKPGQSGNPTGRPSIPEDVKKARKLNQIEVSRILNKYMNMPVSEIEAEAKDLQTSALEGLIGRIIMEAHKYGDYTRVNFLFDRMIGKVTEKVEHKLPKPTVIKLLNNEGTLVLSNELNENEEE